MVSLVSFSQADGVWFWAVKGDAARLYSLGAGAYVPVTDPAYAAWLAAGNAPTEMESEADLFATLAFHRLPVPGAPRSATGYALLMALTDAQRDAYGAAVKPWDQRRLSMRGSDHIPEDSPLVARVAPLLKTTPAAWFDAALKPTAS